MELSALFDEMKKASAEMYPDRRVVVGDGDAESSIMLIGEAPGGDEEKQGKPFVGKAGKNLTEFLKLIGLERENLYLSNVVKIRPYRLSEKTGRPVNRPPDRKEIDFFSEFLYREIDIIKPKIIVTLGNVPLQAVLRDRRVQIGGFHGKPVKIGEITVFPLYHPAAIIYNRKLESVYYEDIEKLNQGIKEGLGE